MNEKKIFGIIRKFILNIFFLSYIIIKNIGELAKMNDKVNLEEINVFISYLEIYIISIFTYYIALKITDSQEKMKNKILLIVICGIIAIICAFIKSQTNSFYSMMCLALMASLIFSKFQKKDITYSVMVIALSLSINYFILFLSTLVTYFPNAIMKTQSDYIEFISLMAFYMVFVYGFTKIKRFKNRTNISKR